MLHRLRPAALAIGILVAACAPATPTTSPQPPDAPSSTAPVSNGPLPIIIGTDMAGDDLLAVMALLREPAVEVLAIAVDGNGETHCVQGMHNMLHLLEAFDAADIPIGCGREEPGPNGRLFPDEWRLGADAFYGVELPPLEGSLIRRDAVELIRTIVDAADRPPTVVLLGPWTNVADALAADASLAGRIGAIHAMAGAIDVSGNVQVDEVTFEHGVEWNVAVDPDAFRAVLAHEIPVTLVPLDATNDVPVPADFATILEEDHAAAGADIAFEMYARSPALTIDTSFWDTLAAAALVDPSLVTWEDLTVTVEPSGPSAGRLVRSPTGRPIRAAMSADDERFLAALLGALRRGDPRPRPFDAATVNVAWDGAACRMDDPPEEPGTAVVSLRNDAAEPVTIALAGVAAPRTWTDVVTYLDTVELSDQTAAPPDWILQLSGFSETGPGSGTTSIVELPAGEVGAVCAVGAWPDFTFVLSEPVSVGTG